MNKIALHVKVPDDADVYVYGAAIKKLFEKRSEMKGFAFKGTKIKQGLHADDFIKDQYTVVLQYFVIKKPRFVKLTGIPNCTNAYDWTALALRLK